MSLPCATNKVSLTHDELIALIAIARVIVKNDIVEDASLISALRKLEILGGLR